MTPNYSTSAGVHRGRRYIFKHALIQDAAYHSLLKGTAIPSTDRAGAGGTVPRDCRGSAQAVAHPLRKQGFMKAVGSW